MNGKSSKKFVPENTAHAGLPPALLQGMRDRAKETAREITFAADRFKREIDEIPAGYAREIGGAAYWKALALMRAFRAGDTARIVAECLTARV